MNNPTSTCPCGSGHDYNDCCGLYISGNALPDTPVALMRSRYTAFTKKDMDYIKNTMRGKALKKADLDSTEAWIGETTWLGLTIQETKSKTPTTGTVHFIARYEQNGQPHELEEISDFEKIGGKWFYTQGRQRPNVQSTQPKIGRNDPCSCGSGKKFKQCCGR